MRTFFITLWSICLIIFFSFLLSCFYGFFYPIKYKEEIIYASNNFHVSPAIIASVINVESGYNKDRISAKGAIGLMQILPSTGEEIAKKLGREFNEEMLYNPGVNVEFGTFYLSYLLDYFNNFDLAICAYNAGMGNVKDWMKNEEYVKDGDLIKIPFKETADYHNKILKNLRYYKKKY